MSRFLLKVLVILGLISRSGCRGSSGTRRNVYHAIVSRVITFLKSVKDETKTLMDFARDYTYHIWCLEIQCHSVLILVYFLHA